MNSRFMKKAHTKQTVRNPEGLSEYLFTAMCLEHSAQKLSRKFNKTEWINAMTKALLSQTA
jgi:hypothetical protein